MSRFVARSVPVAMAACILVACGGEDEGATENTQLSADNPVTVMVGTIPAADNAPIFLAIQEGYFEEEGLDVQTQMVAGGSAALPAMVAGDIQFSTSNWVTVLQAASQGLPVQMSWEISGGAEGVNSILTAAESPYQEPADLRGQTIAVNTLGSNVELYIRECFAAHGLQDGDYSMVEIPFPDMPAAVQGGQVAAAFMGEPFDTIAQGQGQRVIVDPSTCTDRLSQAPTIGVMTTAGYAADNPEITAGFNRALERGLELAASDPQSVIDILPTFTQLTPELAASITQPAWLEDRAPDADRGSWCRT